MQYKTINKQEYIKLYETITDDKASHFAKAAIGAWDYMSGWDRWDPRVLEEDGKINSVCFMKVSNQVGYKVLYICNIFTLPEFRKKGYGRILLDENIKEAVSIGASSIRMDCNKKALPFYDSLNAVYWGVALNKSMFCDLPINSKGVESFGSHKGKTASEIISSYDKKLQDAKIKWFHKKLRDHQKLDYGHPSLYDNFMANYKQQEISTLGI